MPIDCRHPISIALQKTKISKDLQLEFIKFLTKFSNWENQAVYLLRDKKKSIQFIVSDLFGVPVKEQSGWKKVVKKAEDVDAEIKNIIKSYEERKNALKAIQIQHRFKDWKQQHGFESIPPEIGDIHTIIRLKKIHSDQLGSAVVWSFNRSRYGKQGWGTEKVIVNPKVSLLDNNNNPGWYVRQYLEDNVMSELYKPVGVSADNAPESDARQVAEDEAHPNDPADDTVMEHTKPKKNEEGKIAHIANPIIFSSFDSHCLLYMLFGHPLLFSGGGVRPIRNTLKKATFALNYFRMNDYYLLWGTFGINKNGNEITINPEDMTDNPEHFFLDGHPPGLIFEAYYYVIDETVMSPFLMESSLGGIVIPNDEADTCFANIREHYGHIELVKLENEEILPNIHTRHMHSWKAWFAKPEGETQMFRSDSDAVKLTLDPKTTQFKSNKLALRIERLDGWENRIMNRGKIPRVVSMLTRLEKLIQNRTPENGAYIFERIAISQILTLSTGYPYAYGFDGKPLHADKTFCFRITVKTQKNEQKKFSLSGKLIHKENGKNKAVNMGTGENGDKINTFGMVPCYHLHNGQMHRVNEYSNGRLVNDSLAGIRVDETEIVDFYATAIPYLKQRGVAISDPEGLLRVSALFNYRLFGTMKIREIRGMLMGRLSILAKTDIGEFKYPMGNDKDEFSQVIDGVNYQIPRNVALEQALFDKLYEHGWLDESDNEYSIHENQTMRFFMEILPALPEDSNLVYLGVNDLKKWKIRKIQPSISTGIKTNIDWFDVDIKIEYNGHALDIEKILEFWKSPKCAINVEGKDGLVVIDKDWLTKFAPILNRLAEVHKAKKNEAANSISMKVEKYHIGLINELEQAAAVKNTDKKWRGTVKKLNAYKKIKPIAIPDVVKATMRDYQIDGVRWLLFLREFNFGGILADDMGLGKTLQVLCFLAICKKKREFKYPNLVIAPTSVAGNWVNEIKKFVPHFQVVMLYGGGRKELYKQIKSADLVITTYGLLQRDIDTLLEYKFDILILDEAQAIKNNRSKTTLSVGKINSEMRLSLSGTPIENSVSELWSQFNFLMPGFLGSLKNFQSMYISTFQKNSLKKREAYSFLRRQTRPFILRRMKTQVAKELPPKTEQILYCEMEAGQRKLYNAILEIVRKKIKEKIDKDGLKQAKITIFDALIKLRQICSDPRLSNLSGDSPPASAKMKLFVDIVSEIVSEGHRVLVFSHFVKMLNLMHEPLTNMNIPFLQLDGNSRNRVDLINRFQNDDFYPVMLISLKAGGTGINLTAADYVIHYDPWWNPAAEAQATDRVHRIGQNNRVFVYKLITKNSIEEKILELQTLKLSIAEKIVGVSDDIENMLDMNSIREIFQF